MQILSWNVNGIRAADRKGFFEWFKKESPDILCLQEIKAVPEQVPPHLRNTPGYHIFWSSAERKGYSGVATFTREKPIKVKKGFGIEKFDREGRILVMEFSSFTLFNVYFPNGKKNRERLDYKLKFYDTFLAYADNLKSKSKDIVVCGDFNTAHKEIDLANPKENEKYSGFLPIEREWMDNFESYGYIDTFRYFHPEGEQYTWWTYRFKARERNIGWRIDYFFVTEGLINKVQDSIILKDVYGSDHAPILLRLK